MGRRDAKALFPDPAFQLLLPGSLLLEGTQGGFFSQTGLQLFLIQSFSALILLAHGTI